MKQEIKVWDYAQEILEALPKGVLMTVKADDRVNTMTIGWGALGIEWGKPIFIAYVRESRFTKELLDKNPEFTVNIPYGEYDKSILGVCGSKSGRDTDKWKDTGLTKAPASKVSVPLIQESPVNLECKVVRIDELGSHHMFLAEVVAVQVSEEYMDEKGKFCLNETGLLAYSHGEYRALGEPIGTFGYSVKKKKK